MYTCIVSSIWPQWSFGVFGINTPGELYDKNGKQVIEALVSALLPDSDRHSYRVNLYVARTLARIKPSWQGTKIRGLGKAAHTALAAR